MSSNSTKRGPDCRPLGSSCTTALLEPTCWATTPSPSHRQMVRHRPDPRWPLRPKLVWHRRYAYKRTSRAHRRAYESATGSVIKSHSVNVALSYCRIIPYHPTGAPTCKRVRASSDGCLGEVKFGHPCLRCPVEGGQSRHWADKMRCLEVLWRAGPNRLLYGFQRGQLVHKARLSRIAQLRTLHHLPLKCCTSPGVSCRRSQSACHSPKVTTVAAMI